MGVLSWAVYAPFRGQGLASRAVRLLVEWAFDALALERVEAHVNPENRASVRTALRAGLRREGQLRGNATLAGVRQDTVVLGRRRDDALPDTQRGLHGDARLDPADQAGHRPGRPAVGLGSRAPLRARLQARVGPAGRRRRPARVPGRLRRARGPGGAGPRRHAPAPCSRSTGCPPCTGGPTPRSSSSTSEPSTPPSSSGHTCSSARSATSTGPAPSDWPGHVAPYNERLLTALHRHAGGTLYLENGTPTS